MLTTGGILRKKRERKKLNLDQVEKAIKIKKKFLKFLEKDDFRKLPSETYARGFVKNYAEFLGLSSDKVLAVFRRQFREEKKSSLSFQNIGEGNFFQITPMRIKWGVILLTFLLFFCYLFRQYQSLTQGPSLILFEPDKNMVIHESKIIIRGKTDSNARVFINNQEIYPDEKGEFSQEISLSEGENEITIFAENQRGTGKTVAREITFEPF